MSAKLFLLFICLCPWLLPGCAGSSEPEEEIPSEASMNTSPVSPLSENESGGPAPPDSADPGPDGSSAPPASPADGPGPTLKNHEPAPPSSPDQDRIPVLVKLHLSAPPGAEIGQEDKTRLIAQSSEQVITRLVDNTGITRASLQVKKYTYSPVLSLQLTPSEISIISSFPEVEEVVEDKPSGH